MLYHEWFPQILYNHHQSGPAGTVVCSPPLRDPYNYNLDPLLMLGLQALGTHMHTRLAAEGKPGATMRVGRAVRRLVERRHPQHGDVSQHHRDPDRDDRQPDADAHPARRCSGRFRRATSRIPIAPQEWHFRQSIEYSMSLNRAVLDYASRIRENLLFNIYGWGKRSIERGSARLRGRRSPSRSRSSGGRARDRSGGEPCRRSGR